MLVGFQLVADNLKAYEHGEMQERQESRNRAIGQLDVYKRQEFVVPDNIEEFDIRNYV